ncbi:MAG: hypothetical protein ACRDXX_20425, partial [Stackebrandtia sp.]
MSKASPVTVIGLAFGVSAATALAQLGLASGMAILIWREGSVAEWAAQLSWAAWLAAVSTVAGGIVAGRLSDDTVHRIVAVLGAGVGAYVLAPLTAVPAMRFSDTDMATAPFVSVAIGSAAGVAMACLVMLSRAVSVNVTVSVAATWALAALAAFLPIGEDAGDEVRLGVWGLWPDLIPEVAPPLLVISLLVGACAAWLTSDGPEDHRVVAVSGAAGPLLLVAAYGASGQPDVGLSAQWTGIWIGGYAVLAGLLGSLLVNTMRRAPAAPAGAATETQPAADEPYPGPTEAYPSATDRYDEAPYAASDVRPPADHTYEMPTAAAASQVNPNPYLTERYPEPDDAAYWDEADQRSEYIRHGEQRSAEAAPPAEEVYAEQARQQQEAPADEYPQHEEPPAEAAPAEAPHVEPEPEPEPAPEPEPEAEAPAEPEQQPEEEAPAEAEEKPKRGRKGRKAKKEKEKDVSPPPEEAAEPAVQTHDDAESWVSDLRDDTAL